MIREALEGTDTADDRQLEKLANDITSPVSPKGAADAAARQRSREVK
jgi:serine/threonine-protein phosphatase 2B catalytic subunit